MKILTVGRNYPDCPFHIPEKPLIGFKPDSTLLRDGKPFFMPDFSEDIEYELSVVVRIDRLGKCIAPRFASRYYREVTLGIDWIDRDLQTKLVFKTWPWDLSNAFDNSAVIGSFVPLSELGGDVQALPFRLYIDGRCVCEGNTSEMIHRVDDTLAYVSRFMTLKMGDLLFTGSPKSGIGPGDIDQHFEGYIGERKVLDFHVR